MTNRILLVFLGIFLLLFGLAAVTNFKFEWDTPIMGYSALIAGVVCLFIVALSFKGTQA